MDPKFKACISFVIPSILFIITSIPLILKKIPPNGLYGIRVPKTCSNEDIWYKANQFGGVCFLISGLITLIGSAMLFLNKEALSFAELNGIGFGLLVGPISLSIVLTLIYVNKL